MRDIELKTKRDTDLYNRFLELSEVQKIRFDEVLKRLGEEFYLKESRVLKIIREFAKNGVANEDGITHKKQKYFRL